jgi:hypothetical protein
MPVPRPRKYATDAERQAAFRKSRDEKAAKNAQVAKKMRTAIQLLTGTGLIPSNPSNEIEAADSVLSLLCNLAETSGANSNQR